jgi:lipopolysaccharide export system permease protein
MNLAYLEPFANKIKRQEIQKTKKSEGKYLTRSSLEGGRFWYKTDDYFASFTFFDRSSKSLRELEIYYFTPGHSSTQIIRSKTATFVQRGEWRLTGATELSNLDSETFPMQQFISDKIVKLNEEPEDFGEFEADLTTLNFFKLKTFIGRLSKTGINTAEYEIILLNKIFLSMVCLVFALIPLSTIFNPNRRSDSFGKSAVFTLLITIVFWVLYSSAIAFGNSGSISPLTATSIVPVLFLLFVLWTYLKNQKLSS